MQQEAKSAINKYLDSLCQKYPQQIRFQILTHTDTTWELYILYYVNEKIIKDYVYLIEWQDDGCTINLSPSPSWVEPMKHKSVQSLMMYISRYHG